MDSVTIIPQAQQMCVLRGEVKLAAKNRPATISVGAAEDPLALRAASILASAIRKAGARCRRIADHDRAVIRFDIAETGDVTEMYGIDTAEGVVRVEATDARAAVHAAHTLRQLIRGRNGTVVMPRIFVQDWPTLAYRGMFQEATYASSLMTLDDWRALVDQLAQLKMNTLMVGLYSCWRRVDHLKEFMFVPSRRYPKLVSPQRKEYYSAVTGKRVTEEFLPRIFEEDFFGDLIAYAQDRGVTVVPYVSSLGHNTLIPRMYPEVSMLDRDGKPKGYGFCTSNPKTYDLLFGLFDEIIERYMQPHGLTLFGIGMDEVRDWCDCPRCRRAKNVGLDNFMVRHVFRVLEHLKKRGMTRVVMWHDMLERGGLLNRAFVRELKKRRLEDVIGISWWAYGDLRGQPELAPRRVYNFASFRPELGLANWSAPSAGWNFAMPLALSRVGNVRSIMTHAAIADRDHAEAMVSYSCHDPIFLEGLHALAEYSWNPAATNDLRVFHERFCRAVFRGDWAAGQDCFEQMQQAFEPWSGLFNMMFSRVHEHLAPGPAIFGLDPGLCRAERFASSMSVLRHCAATFRSLARARPEHRPVILMYAADCQYVEAVLGVALGTLEAIRDYRRARTEPDDKTLAAAFAATVKGLDARIDQLARAMAAIEKVRHPANAPYVLNRATGLLDWARDFRKRLGDVVRQLRKGGSGTLPLFAGRLDAFYSEHLGVKSF